MNNVQLCTITKAGTTVFRFVVYDDFNFASLVAGGVMDALCDYHGSTDWNYQVSTVCYVGSMTPVNRIVQEALSKVAF